MASARAMIERRRSGRIPVRIPVKIFSDSIHSMPHGTLAEAIAVSRYGGLIRVSYPLTLGSRLEVMNVVSQEIREFRIVRARESKEKGYFEIGVEILHPTRNFWGVQFPGERRAG